MEQLYRRAQRASDQHPGRDAIALDVDAVLAHGGGGIHCITQQVPAVSA